MIQRQLNRLTAEAEGWAASGRRRADEWPIRRKHAPFWTPPGPLPRAATEEALSVWRRAG